VTLEEIVICKVAAITCYNWGAHAAIMKATASGILWSINPLTYSVGDLWITHHGNMEWSLVASRPEKIENFLHEVMEVGDFYDSGQEHLCPGCAGDQGAP
jgi:hypothetical protein